MQRLGQHLWWIRDSCSVYALRSRGRALLIDCGTALTPNAAARRSDGGGGGEPEADGLGTVEQVLLTHFHRDQCAAAAAWREAGAHVVVPFAERRYVEEADLQRAAYDVYDNYASFYPCFGPARDLWPAAHARDYEVLPWDPFRFEVVPLPGHTFGSVGYLFEVDGQRVLACGDLLADSGHLPAYYWAQWRYMDFQGHVNLLESLDRVIGLNVDLILPGHGEPFAPDRTALEGLRGRLREIWERFHGRRYLPWTPDFVRLSDHVWEVANTQARTYLVCDGEGHALCIDCGYASNAPIAANPHRFVDHLTGALETELDIGEVEHFIPSHYHDDHLAGYPALRARYGTGLVTATSTRDLLQHPERYDMPCLLPEGLTVTSALAPGEAFQWRGLRFDVLPHPGQTLYDQLVAFEVDGLRYLAIGDAISGLGLNEQRDHIHSFIPKNRTPLTEYGRIADRIAAQRPDVVLTGHGGALRDPGPGLERWRTWMGRWQELLGDVVAADPPDVGLDPRWLEFYPYKVRVRPGEERIFHLWITNHADGPRSCRLRFRAAAGMEVEPLEQALTVPGKAREVVEVRARFPEVFRTHSLPLLADVEWDGEPWGEGAEAVAYW